MGSNSRRNQAGWSWLCACGAACALGCGERTPECHGARCETLEVHVLTWWPNTNNSPAIPLREAAEEQPGVHEVTLGHRATKSSMMAAVERLLLHGEAKEPVDTFLANAGRDVLRWTPCGGEGSSERLVQLNGPGGYTDLRSHFAPEVLDGVMCCKGPGGCAEPGIYALPLGLHQVNHIVYNVARFEGCASESVASPDDFVALLECLRPGGKRVISAPVGDCQAACTQGEEACRDCRSVAGESLSYLLESLVLLVSTPEQYQSYWRGQSWRSPDEARRAEPLRAALQLFEGDLRPFVNDCSTGSCGAPPRNAKEALAEVLSGDAAFLVMPDWYMLEAQQDGTGAVGGMPFPGTSDTYLFMTDVFTIPVASTPGTSVEAGFRWLDALRDPGLQERFAAQKYARAALAGSGARMLPSLEAQLPASIDPARLRGSLNDLLLGGPGEAAALEALMAGEFEEADRQGTLRGAPCDPGRCDSAPCAPAACGPR